MFEFSCFLKLACSLPSLCRKGNHLWWIPSARSKTLVLDHFLVKTSEYLSFNLLLKDCSFDSSEDSLRLRILKIQFAEDLSSTDTPKITFDDFGIFRDWNILFSFQGAFLITDLPGSVHSRALAAVSVFVCLSDSFYKIPLGKGFVYNFFSFFKRFFVVSHRPVSSGEG